jgi:hypothetical protein
VCPLITLTESYKTSYTEVLLCITMCESSNLINLKNYLTSLKSYMPIHCSIVLADFDKIECMAGDILLYDIKPSFTTVHVIQVYYQMNYPVHFFYLLRYLDPPLPQVKNYNNQTRTPTEFSQNTVFFSKTRFNVMLVLVLTVTPNITLSCKSSYKKDVYTS